MLRIAARRVADAARAAGPLVRSDAPLYLFIAIYTLAGLAFLDHAGAAGSSAYAIYFCRWLILFAFFFPLVALLLDWAFVLHRFDRHRSLAFRCAFSAARLARLFAGMVLLQGMVFFQGTFTSVKNAMSAWQGGFPHDRVQADIDRFLHLGVDPWIWLHAIAGFDWLRPLVEWNYGVLFFVLTFGTLFFVVTSPRANAIRTRYVIAFMLTWIVVGNLLAGPFLSAGPIFYGVVTGDEARFAPLLEFLARGADTPNAAISYRDYLWELHVSGQAGFGSGISAFPSVHVALVTLNALFAAEYSRRLGHLAFGYAALIAASSVYLGWHYAIDGYVAALVTVLIHVGLRRAFARAGAARRTLPEPAIATAS